MSSSIDDRDDGEGRGKKKEKSRKPGNTAFRQQRLKAWQPILTPKSVLPLFFAIGVIFAPIGGLLLYASAEVREISIDYTHCTEDTNNNLTKIPDKYVSTYFKKDAVTGSAPPQWQFLPDEKSNLTFNPDYKEKVCKLQFEIPEDIKPPVLVYYRLSNFYQNHRRYVQSLDEDQLRGNARSYKDIENSDNCDPLAGNSTENKPYYPCGLIANSIFNDTFSTLTNLNAKGNAGEKEYPLSDNGIAWGSDKERYGETQYKPEDVLPPPNWVERYKDGKYNETSMPKLREDQAFQVWMRTAGLPTFSKLALRNDKDVLEAGRYEMKIYSRFPVKEYSGTKTIVISTRTVMGGRNPFLGIAYVVVGALCIVLGAVFTARHLIKPRKLGDHTYLSWNNDDSGAAAQASGRDIRPE